MTLDALHARADELSRRLDGLGTGDADVRHTLKQQIVDLYREVDAEAQRAIALKATMRTLAQRWRGGDGVSGRIDHLGASTFIEKGWSKLSVGDAVGAEAALRKALELAPNTDEAEALLAWSLAAQRRFDDALIAVYRSLTRDAGYALAHVVAGWVCVQKGAAREASEHLHTAVKRASATRDVRALGYAHLFMGVLQRDNAMYAEAERCFARALEAGPNLLQARYEWAQTKWMAGDRTAALGMWRDGASLNRFNEWGKRCAETAIMVEQGGDPPSYGAL